MRFHKPLLFLIALFAVISLTIIYTSNAKAATQTVTYCNGQQLDVISPSGNATSSNPAIIQIHGGAWMEGSRVSINGMDPADILPDAMNQLSQNGFVIISIDYRVAEAGAFPNNITDVKCAIRYIRANAAQFSIDPNRIGLVGDSAGAHLAYLAGLADASAGWDTGDNASTSSVVQAVAGYSGPTYIEEEGRKWPQVWGTNTALWEQGSPTYWATKNASKPPLLIVHGENDDTVPADHGPALYNAAQQGGINATLQMVANAGHEIIGSNVSPDYPTLIQQTVDFFMQHLKSSTTVTPTLQLSPTWGCLGACPTLDPSPTLFNEPTQQPTEIPNLEPSPTSQVTVQPTTELSVTPGNPNGNGDGNNGHKKRRGSFSQFLQFLMMLLEFIKQLFSSLK